MIPVSNKTYKEHASDELARLEVVLNDYWEKSRRLESETVVDLEKHIWLANGAGATISLGFLQNTNVVNDWQLAGSWTFVVGIVLLVILKFVSAFNSSRDRSRFESARVRFYRNEVSAKVFSKIRDKQFRRLKRLYLAMQYGAGLSFVLGLVTSLVGIQCAA